MSSPQLQALSEAVSEALGEPRRALWLLLAWSSSAALVWLVNIFIYRRYFHPLAKIPGPFLPAVTRLYLWYYSVVVEGQFYRKIEQWHKTYGNMDR